MAGKMKELRFSHSEGHTEACFDKNGKYILTAGADGDVRVYSDLLDDDAVSFRVGTLVTAIAVREKEMAVATDCNDVKTFSIPEGIQQEILLRFTARVNTICFNKNGDLLAAGSSDFAIKIVTKEENIHKSLNGHNAPVLSVAFSPDDQYLASSSCDGMLKIWNISNQGCIKSLSIFPKSNDTSTSKTLCKIAWCHGKEKLIAAPVGKGIMLISTETWAEVITLNSPNSEITSIVSFSPCGGYIASSSISGDIIVWDAAKMKEIESMKHENGSKITSLNWNPKTIGELVYADDQGQFSICSDVLSKTEKTNAYNSADLFADSDDELINDRPTRKRLHDDRDNGDENGVDDDDDDDIPIGSAHKKHRVQNFDNFIADEADDDDIDDADISLDLIKEGLVPKPVDDMAEAEDLDSMQDFIVEDKPKKPEYHIPFQQKAFQSGATPSHLTHRLMTWNSVGIIRCHNEDDSSTIDIEFHDAGLHHPLHLSNTMNHTIAALSSTAVVLACQSQDEVPSKLVCLHFGTWDSNKEWTASMPKGEDIKSIAVNQSYIAVATSANIVRIFTVGGLQFNLFNIPGPVVSMAMCDTQLLIVYHQGTGLPECQCLGARLFEINSKRWNSLTEHQLPLSKKATLAWLGFSAEQTPVAVDSNGVVRMLQRSFGNTWIPVLNVKNQTKTKSDRYWVIGVTENPPEIRCILCKGANFPATIPRPVPSSLTMKIPLCDGDTEKGQMEETYIQNKVVTGFYDYHRKKGVELDEISNAEAKKSEIQLLIKLFALSCKSDRIFRAVEICELMPNAETVNLAIQYATRMRKMNLAQRLGEIARRKALEDDDDDDNYDQISDSEDEPIENYRPRSVSMPSARNATYVRPIKPSPINGRNTMKLQVKRKEPVDISDEDSDTEINERAEMKNGKEEHDIQMSDDNEIEGSAPTEKTESRLYSSNSQGRQNPFKLVSRTISNSASDNNCKGTSYFETLESTMPPKNKTGLLKPESVQQKGKGKNTQKSTIKQATLFKKAAKNTSNKKPDEGTKIPQSQPKKVTGFGLFRDQLLEDGSEIENEEFMKSSLDKWKNLDPAEKKDWNMKAKDQTKQTGNMNSNIERNGKNNDEAKTNAKSKLAKFAFLKNE